MTKIKIVAAVGRPPDFKNGECGFLPKAATTVLDSPLILIFQKFRAIQCRQKILFHPGKTFSGDGISRHQDQFHRLRKFVLVPPETFAEQPPRAAAPRKFPAAPARICAAGGTGPGGAKFHRRKKFCRGGKGFSGGIESRETFEKLK